MPVIDNRTTVMTNVIVSTLSSGICAAVYCAVKHSLELLVSCLIFKTFNDRV